ncbi:fatty acid desaturase [Rhizobium sp.]|jgi:fatty acid desaturase|uniref:fatty acid desaturase family protein n=1 Tax=Rhizobium sp. TaxID=391 RepID=UPI000E9E354F|nr:fatty acid desaturase [Rhizobium sp.]
MKIFAYSKWDIVPVLSAMAHLAFNIMLIVGFHTRPLWLSAALGCLYAVSISWNINSISHNFIHTPYFTSKRWNYAFSLLESVAIGFSQTYYHWVHMRHHSGNSDRPDENGNTVDMLSIYKHGTNGQPENVFSYTFLSFFRDDIGAIHKAIAAKRPFEAAWGRFELITFIAIALAALAYDWRATLFFVPFYYLGNCLSSLNGYYEHLNGDPDEPIAWGVSSYERFYNWLWFGNGYHAEHHYRPKTHWTELPQLHERIKEEQEKAGTHVISTCHALGFIAKENWQTDLSHEK